MSLENTQKSLMELLFNDCGGENMLIESVDCEGK